MNTKVKGYFWGCISSATFGLIPLFALPLMRKGIPHDSLLCYRFACASLLIALFMLFKKESFRIAKREIVPMAVLGILYALSAQYLLVAYDYLGVGTASTILFIYPVFVAILMAVFFKEKVSLITVAAIAIAFLGVCLLYKGDNGVTLNLLGLGAILIAAMAYSVYIVAVNQSRIQLMSGYKLTLYVMASSAVFFLFKAQLTVGLQPLPDTRSIVELVMLALPTTAISCVAMIFAVQYVGSTVTAILGALEPLVAVAVGVIAFKEAITQNLVLGMLLILIAVIMIILSDYLHQKFSSKSVI